MPALTPCLWFDDQAEEAVAFYVSVFPNSAVLDVLRRPEGVPGEPGSVLTMRFSLGGTELLALNGGPSHYGFDEAVSFIVQCSTDEELDYYWAALSDGGEEIACGWLKDRYGLRWQVVPEELGSILGDPDPERAARAAAALATMKKLDVRALRAAAEGAEPLPAGS